jgi:hypothetical protein
VLALTHEVSPLRLYRLAHGRTAADIVARLNEADPAGTAGMPESRLYDFESWPESGRRPSAHLLTALAKIYQTTARSLMRDEAVASYGAADRNLICGADFCHLDANRPPSPERVPIEGDIDVVPAGAKGLDASACVRLLQAIGCEETDVKRRELLFELGLVLGGSQALDLLRILTPDEEERLAGVLRSTWRMDETTVQTFEKLTMHARQADDKYGPATLLPVVNEHRMAIERLLARESMPLSLHDRLLGAYAQMSQLAGFLSYDLRDYGAVEQSLRDGLQAALDLGDPTLIGYLHYWLGRAAEKQDRTATVFDHAFAAREWAARSSSKFLVSIHEGLLSLAYAAEGKAAASTRAYECALALARAPKENEPAFLYWVSPPSEESRRAWSLIRMNQPGPALTVARQCLADLDARCSMPDARDRGCMDRYLPGAPSP